MSRRIDRKALRLLSYEDGGALLLIGWGDEEQRVELDETQYRQLVREVLHDLTP